MGNAEAKNGALHHLSEPGITPAFSDLADKRHRKYGTLMQLRASKGLSTPGPFMPSPAKVLM